MAAADVETIALLRRYERRRLCARHGLLRRRRGVGGSRRRVPRTGHVQGEGCCGTMVRRLVPVPSSGAIGSTSRKCGISGLRCWSSGHHQGRGRTSGVEVRSSIAYLFRVRDGEIARLELFSGSRRRPRSRFQQLARLIVGRGLVLRRQARGEVFRPGRPTASRSVSSAITSGATYSQPRIGRPVKSIGRAPRSDVNSFSACRVEPHDQLLTDHTAAHVPADHECDAAEHLALGDVGLPSSRSRIRCASCSS